MKTQLYPDKRLKRTVGVLVGTALLATVAVTRAAEPTKTDPPAESVPGVDSGRAALAKWVETQQIIAAEKKDWQQGKELLQARIDLVNGEMAEVEEQLAEQPSEGSDTIKKKSELDHESHTLQDSGKALGDWATELERSLDTLHPRLPEPLQTKLGPLYSRMPKDPANTTVSLA